MSGEVDYYDVQAMIRDALHPLEAKLRDLENETAALRDDLRDTHRYMQNEIDSLERTLSSRTEHLV